METKYQTPRVDRFTWNIPKMRCPADAWEIHDPSFGSRLQREWFPVERSGKKKLRPAQKGISERISRLANGINNNRST